MSILFQPCCSDLAGSALLQGIMDLCQMALFNAESSIRSQIAPDRIYRHELFSPGCSIFCPSSVLRLQFVFCIFQVAPFSVPAVYASSIICMVSLRCIIALFYELLMEVSNPAQSQEKLRRCTTQCTWQQKTLSDPSILGSNFVLDPCMPRSKTICT